MKVSVENGDGCRRTVNVNVPIEDVRDDYDMIVKTLVKGAKISGFRPGRAPRELVEKRYSKAIMQETRDRLVPKFYNKAIEQEELNPVAVVDVDNINFNPATGLSFKIELDVQPEFKLPKYKKISLKRKSTAISDEDVEKTIDDILKRFARYEDANDKQVATGDLVQIDYSAVCDGKPLQEVSSDAGEIAKGDDFWLPTDGMELVPGINDALMGASVGDEIKFTAEFPEDYRVKGVAGKKADYTVMVKAIRALIIPEMDDEMLKRFDVDSEDDLRAKIRKDLEETAENGENARLKSEIAKHLVEKTKIDPPRSLVEREAYTLMQESMERLRRQGVSESDMAEHGNALFASLLKQAEDKVKVSYIIRDICKEEELDVSDDDVEKRLAELGQRYGMTAEAVRTELEKEDSDLSSLRNDILGNKAFDLMLENAKIKE